MSDVARPRRKVPHGKRPDEVTRLRNRDWIEGMYARLQSVTAVIRAASLPLPEGLGMPERTVRDYLVDIRADWDQTAGEERARLRRMHAQALTRRAAAAEARGKYAACARFQEMLIRLQGLHAPDVLEVRDGGPQAEDFDGWSVEDLDTYQRLKARARGEGPGLTVIQGGRAAGNGRNGAGR